MSDRATMPHETRRILLDALAAGADVERFRMDMCTNPGCDTEQCGNCKMREKCAADYERVAAELALEAL